SLEIDNRATPRPTAPTARPEELLLRSAEVDRAGGYPDTAPVLDKRIWPRVDAPEVVPAGKPFDVIVGFGATHKSTLTGGPVLCEGVRETETIAVAVELSAGSGVVAPNGWSRTMRVPMSNPLSAQVRVELRGIETPDPQRPFLTMLDVRYVIQGTVCGIATRPLVIVHSSGIVPSPQHLGDAWLSSAVRVSPMTLTTDAHGPDLTIEITKPDRNASSGQYVATVYSPHALTMDRGPFPLDLGQDAKTFARAIVEEVRLFAKSELLDNTLEGLGRLVAQRLPGPVFDALR